LILTLGVAVATVASATPSNAAGPPNVVVMLADDLGWADVGYHESPIQTPSIDQLAEEGVQLHHFYAAPICSPTRAALLTGRDPLKLGIAYDQIHPWYNAGLAPNSLTIARAFQQAGYQTAIVGKWHLGHTQAHQLPGAQGFDHFWGHLHTNTDFFVHQREGGHDLQENGKSVHEDGKYLTRLEGREAVRFLRERERDKPFFLYVPFTAPHSPMQAPEATIQKYASLPKQNSRRIYAAMVDEMDQAIGAILRELDEQGLRDDTLVMFLSDNGGSTVFGGVNTPLRGQKGQAFEGGIRVPAVVRWPGQLQAGGVFDDMMTAMDVLPTLASAAGVALNGDTELDGIDQWRAIRHGESATRTQPVGFASEIPLPGIIQLALFDGPLKLVQIVSEGQTETHTQTFLFDIRSDPGEQNDLAAERPQEVERLAALMRDWRSQHPMAGTRGTLVPHPGWVAPHDWAEAVDPAHLLQPEWNNELPFSKALLDATAHRGVLVDAQERARLLEQEAKRDAERESP
jgi:arylsulfatase A-like enzyme